MHVYARAGKSSPFKRFLGSLPIITTENIVILCIFNQGNAVFEVLMRKIKVHVQSSIVTVCAAHWFREVKSDRACFHSQLVKQRPKKSQSFSFASFTVKTGYSEQAIQSSVRGRHGYNLKSVDRK